MTRRRLTTMLDKFLKDRRLSGPGGDWAFPVGKDIEQLCGILDALIELKFARDADGDYPVNYTVVNRTKYGPLHYVPVPYDHLATTPEQKRDVLRAIWINHDIASRATEIYLKMLNYEMSDAIAKAQGKS